MGLANLMGGEEVFANKLNFAFASAEPTNFIADYGDGYVSLRQPAGPVDGARVQLRRLPVADPALGPAGEGEDLRGDVDDRRLRALRRGPGPDGRDQRADGDRPVRGDRRRARAPGLRHHLAGLRQGDDRARPRLLPRPQVHDRHPRQQPRERVHPARPARRAAARRRLVPPRPAGRRRAARPVARQPAEQALGRRRSCRRRSRRPRAASRSTRRRSTISGPDRVEVPYGTADFDVAFTPENTSLKEAFWTVTEPDGSPTDKATITSAGLLTVNHRSGRVLVTATAADSGRVTATQPVDLDLDVGLPARQRGALAGRRGDRVVGVLDRLPGTEGARRVRA